MKMDPLQCSSSQCMARVQLFSGATMNFEWVIWSKRELTQTLSKTYNVHRYFSSLQKELSTYDRVLYEMVADKNKMQTNRLGKMRWKPPRRVPGRHGGQGFSIIGTIQRLMAQLLTLEFQLECMDYRQENWYHADLDFDTFQVLQVCHFFTQVLKYSAKHQYILVHINSCSHISCSIETITPCCNNVIKASKLRNMSQGICCDLYLYSQLNIICGYQLNYVNWFQRERGETFFSFAKDLTAISSKAITRAALAPGPHLDPWRAKLLWVSRMVPMPLLGLFVIEGVCAPSDAPLKQVPEMKALLEMNPAAAFKVFLAKQITTE